MHIETLVDGGNSFFGEYFTFCLLMIYGLCPMQQIDSCITLALLMLMQCYSCTNRKICIYTVESTFNPSSINPFLNPLFKNWCLFKALVLLRRTNHEVHKYTNNYICIFYIVYIIVQIIYKDCWC